MKNLAGLPHSRHFGPLVPSLDVRVSTFSDRQVGPLRKRTRRNARKVTRQRHPPNLGPELVAAIGQLS